VTLPGRQGVEKISAIMGQLRKDPPSVIDGTKVTKFKDLLNSKAYEMSSAGFVDAGAITLPSSNVLQFELEDGSKISARPSGTEPKIKFYFSVKAAVSNDLTNAEFDKVKTTCKNRLASLEKALASLMES
jgi:phosphoglucomutase